MYEDILVPTDGSAGASAALEEAIELADQFDATIHSLYVVDLASLGTEAGAVDMVESFEQMGEEATEAAATRARDAGVAAEGSVATGSPHREILDYVDDHGVDLVVMGTHGRTGLERYLLGSVTEKIVRTADVPVLTVRADEDGTEDDE
ncbi:universal stress protein [Halosimplex pelagicum]|uniref:Universal stress protein n=1 Tax=Halosimplex pelagicum TaxID=869886 RepID=A0A7D5P810_9EURY|nr:universal stress protein [Halosimplex pelagicum]QLH81521.1 universal stress protein [Halosimplex pelagicum]